MKGKEASFQSIDEYIAGVPEETQAVLEALRAIIKAAAPEMKEAIAYQMPAFKLQGTIVYFAAWKKHIGFYPASSAAFEFFKDEIAKYKGTSGSIHFPMDKPLPTKLITDIVQFRVAEDIAHFEEKARIAQEKRRKTKS